MTETKPDASKPTDDAKPTGNTAEPATKPIERERSVSKEGSVRIGEAQIDYVVTSSTTFLRDEEGEPRAEIFSVSYVRKGDHPERRPVTFVFNGGPGSSAVWLHFGTLGPRRVVLPDAVHPSPLAEVQDNAHSLLDETDLVFIDPVGTGYSRALGKHKRDAFCDISADVDSIADLIRIWLTRNLRWPSPRFLAGESYGSMRAARLVSRLEGAGISIHGVVLVSSVLQYHTSIFEPANDVPYVLFLPTYAAVAHYHGRLPDPPANLTTFLAEARAFAEADYLLALKKGARLDAATRERITAQLMRFTGLDRDVIERANLRITETIFAKELLRAKRRVVGRLDARYSGFDLDGVPGKPVEDPSYRAVLAPYSSAVNDYLRRELGFEEDRRYDVLNMDVNEGWRFHEKDRMGYPDTSIDLAIAMTQNPHLQVFFANGIYDLATPFFAIEHTVDHLKIDPELRRNITVETYDAGHMMYVHEPSRLRFKADLAAFLGRARAHLI